MAKHIPLSLISQINPLERPIDFQGVTVWLRLPDKETFWRAKPFLHDYISPLHALSIKPLQHWKVRTHTQPIALNVFVSDSCKAWTAEGFDFEIEALEDVIAEFGENNVRVTPGRIDAR